MTSRLEIFNLALGHIGNSDQIQNPDSEEKAAQQCRRFYPQIKREWLQDAPWSFATVAEPLALVSDQPKMGYGFRYRRPAGALRIWAVCTELGMRTWLNTPSFCWTDPARYSLPMIPWQQMGADILTDLDDAYVLFVDDVPELQMTNAKFVGALALGLAAAIAAPMLGTPVGQQLAAQLGRAVTAAREGAIAAGLNERGQDYAPDAPAIQARN